MWNVTASGNNIIVNNSAYGDTEGNDYKNSYTIIDIHSLKSKELVENGNYSVFADGNYVYYGKNENTVYRIDLATNEETFFCDIDGPCYISADSNYVYFDNLQSIYAGTDADNRKIFVYDVEDVVKVRTGATGYDALQNDAETDETDTESAG